ncbi:hypothetical protein P7K49_008110, partial [Saguinus oedipus]
MSCTWDCDSLTDTSGRESLSPKWLSSFLHNISFKRDVAAAHQTGNGLIFACVQWASSVIQGKSSIPHSQELDSIGKEGSRVGTPIECDLSSALERLVFGSNPELSTIRNKDGMRPELDG